MTKRSSKQRNEYEYRDREERKKKVKIGDGKERMVKKVSTNEKPIKRK